jgi:5-methylcytosine-specific restriction endonuclease McrA
MSDLPHPLTPPDCDLRGFEWMQLWGHRMFTSSWYRAARKDGRGGIASLKLYWSAMLQCPAGSLPNDEEELCMLADFGEDMRTWAKHRPVAMHGFVLCADNRWYHPVVAEQVLDAYERKVKAKAGREADAERLRRWRQQRRMPERQWDELREAIFVRDGSKCRRCGSNLDLHCDHVVPMADGGQTTPDNLITLCRVCHSRKTAETQPQRRQGQSNGEMVADTHSETHFIPHYRPPETHFETQYEMRKTVPDSTRQDRPPLSPPQSRGGRRGAPKPPRSGFKAVEQRLATIEGTAEEVAEMHEFASRLRLVAGGGNG